MKVLLVDDHASIRRAVRQLIELKDGYRVVGESQNGSEAVEHVAQLAPDVVLMDINMPVMSGIEATKEIKASHPDVKVLALTAFADMSLVSSMVRAGASGYLLKGGTPTELLESLDAVARGLGALDKEVTRGVMDDVADLYRKEQERADALQHLDRMKSEFISVVTHELNTPLTTIKAGVETLRSNWASIAEPVKFEFLDSMRRQCDRLSRMITHILTVSGIQHGALDLDANVFSLSGVAREVVENLASMAKGRHVQLVAAPGVAAAGDRRLTAEVAAAIVENALVFTSGRVVVRVARVDGTARLEVADDGPGLSEQTLQLLLGRPFMQADSSSTRPVGGLGLSLYMARRALAALGGRLEVDSNPDRGSNFVMVLPSPEEMLEPPASSMSGEEVEVDVYQCPECELRFKNASEMDAHLKLDHPHFHEKWSSVDDYLASEAHRRRRERGRHGQPRND